MAALAALLDAACAGAGRVAVIEGSPGIGKSALLECAKRLAPERGMRALAARGGALERDFSFGVVRQLFEPFVTADALVERGALFEGAAGIAAELLGAQPPAGAQPPSGELFALLHGLHWLTAGIAAAGPLLIALDDARWTDTPSLRFAHYLARRLDELPVLLVLTARSTEPGAPLELIDAIAGEPVATHDPTRAAQRGGGGPRPARAVRHRARRGVRACLARGEPRQPVPAHRARARSPRTAARPMEGRRRASATSGRRRSPARHSSVSAICRSPASGWRAGRWPTAGARSARRSARCGWRWT